MTTLHSLISAAILAVALAFAGSPQLLLAQVYTDLHDFDCTVEGCSPTYPEILAQAVTAICTARSTAEGRPGWERCSR